MATALGDSPLANDHRWGAPKGLTAFKAGNFGGSSRIMDANHAMSLLDEQQRRAVMASANAPLIIAAGAGSGKTRVATLRICKLIMQDRVDPNSILALTFTKKASKEMKERVAKHCGVHVAAEWIKECIDAISPIMRLQLFGEVTETDVEGLHQEEDDDTRQSFWTTFDPKNNKVHQAVAYIARLNKSNDESDHGHCDAVREVLHAYRQRKAQTSAIDYDDFVHLAKRLFSTHHPDQLASVGRKQYILVDEFQDVSSDQMELLKLMLRNRQKQGTITVCGDQDQAIFSFLHGKTRDNFGDFRVIWPDSLIITLNKNYRSTGNVVSCAKAIIKRNRQSSTSVGATSCTDNIAGDKIIVSVHANEDKEVSFVGQDIKRAAARGVAYGHMAVLFRTRVVGKALEKELRRQGIPLHNSAPSQGGAAYTKGQACELLAWLRLALDPLDDAAMARAAKQQQGLGKAAQERLGREAAQGGGSQLQAAQRVLRFNMGGAWTKGQREALRLLVKTVEETARDVSEAQAAAAVLDRLCTRVCARKKESDAPALRKMVEAMKEDLALVGEGSCSSTQSGQGGAVQNRLAALVACVEGTGLKEARRQNVVTLTTVHQAKGLEFGHVWLIRFNEGSLPLGGGFKGDPDTSEDEMQQQFDAHIEEERRLAYVAVSRAKESLHVSWVRQDANGQFGEPSRFLEEIPEELKRPWSKEGPPPAALAPNAAPPASRSPLRTSSERPTRTGRDVAGGGAERPSGQGWVQADQAAAHSGPLVSRGAALASSSPHAQPPRAHAFSGGSCSAATSVAQEQVYSSGSRPRAVEVVRDGYGGEAGNKQPNRVLHGGQPQRPGNSRSTNSQPAPGRLVERNLNRLTDDVEPAPKKQKPSASVSQADDSVHAPSPSPDLGLVRRPKPPPALFGTRTTCDTAPGRDDGPSVAALPQRHNASAASGGHDGARAAGKPSSFSAPKPRRMLLAKPSLMSRRL